MQRTSFWPRRNFRRWVEVRARSQNPNPSYIEGFGTPASFSGALGGFRCRADGLATHRHVASPTHASVKTVFSSAYIPGLVLKPFFCLFRARDRKVIGTKPTVSWFPCWNCNADSKWPRYCFCRRVRHYRSALWLLRRRASHEGIASSKHGNIRKFCLLLESLAHLVRKYRMCWTWFSVTCADEIDMTAGRMVPQRRFTSRITGLDQEAKSVSRLRCLFLLGIFPSPYGLG